MIQFAVEIPYWGQSLLRVLGGLVAVLLPAGTIVYLFLFKMMSFMQSRLGPMEAGPYGSLQLVAEVGKWMQKEDLAPDAADKSIFKIAPIVVLLSSFRSVPMRCSPTSRSASSMPWPSPRSACSASSSPVGRAPASTRCSAVCAPPAS